MECALKEQLSQTSFQRNHTVFTTQLDDLLILLNADRGEYYSLNCTAQTLWQLLEQPLHTQTLIQYLQQRFGLTQAQSEHDVLNWLHLAHDCGLVIETADSKERTTLAKLKQQAYTAPTLEIFELLKHVAGGAVSVSESGNGVLMS